MKRNEIIELNGEEYTLELNRDSFVKIDQYCNIEKSMKSLQSNLYDYIEDFEDNVNPFEDILSDEELDKKIEDKTKTVEKFVSISYWIWLYPNYQFPLSKVKEIVLPYLDNEKDASYISEKLGQYIQECVEIREQYNEERKNLKAQTNKK